MSDRKQEALRVSGSECEPKREAGFGAASEQPMCNADPPYNLQEVVMSETMLAMVALMVVVFFTVSQQRGIMQTEREIASMEMEMMANAAGSDFMQLIATQPFDAATVGVNPQDVVLSDLTIASQFGDSLACPANCTDIDDFNNMQPETISFVAGEDENGDPIQFDFLVTAEVKYVDSAGNESTSPTWMKEVTLFLEQTAAEAEKRLLLQPVELKRQFSPQW